MPNKIFTSVKLPVTGKTIQIKEGKGEHYFNAMRNANSNSGAVLEHLIYELALENNKPVDQEEMKQLPMSDITELMNVIGLMMSNDVPGL